MIKHSYWCWTDSLKAEQNFIKMAFYNVNQALAKHKCLEDIVDKVTVIIFLSLSELNTSMTDYRKYDNNFFFIKNGWASSF